MWIRWSLLQPMPSFVTLQASTISAATQKRRRPESTWLLSKLWIWGTSLVIIYYFLLELIRNAAVGLFYNPDFENKKGPYLEKLDATLKPLSHFLGDQTWLAGNSLSFPDFHLYEMLDEHILLSPNCLKAFPNLSSFHTRFAALPRIAAYMKSDSFMVRPINNKMAGWGNK